MTHPDLRMYGLGFDEALRECAECCFGYMPKIPDFDTPEEEAEFLEGFRDGWNSVEL